METPQAVLKLVLRKLLIQHQAAAATESQAAVTKAAAAAAAARLPTSGESSGPAPFCVPLSVGPGFAGSSGPLNVMMGYQASLQAPPKTWQVEDESVTRVRKSMGKWADLCKSMAKFFGRGINRTVLAMAYREHGVKQCPRILAPFESKDGRVLWDLLEPVDAPPCCSGTGGLVGNRQVEKALRQGGEQGLGGVQGCPEEVASCSGHGPVDV